MKLSQMSLKVLMGLAERKVLNRRERREKPQSTRRGNSITTKDTKVHKGKPGDPKALRERGRYN